MKKEMFGPKLVVKPEGGKDTGRIINRPEKNKTKLETLCNLIGTKIPCTHLVCNSGLSRARGEVETGEPLEA